MRQGISVDLSESKAVKAKKAENKEWSHQDESGGNF